MNRAEIIKLISLLSINYRNWPGEGKEEDAVTLWLAMLGDLDYEIGAAAVKIHLSRSPYPPTISDIRDAAARLQNPNQLEAIDAWGMVTDVIRKYGFYRGEEAMESLPSDVVEMVERFGWRELCLSENVDTLRAQFRMAWETQQKRKKEDAKLTPQLKLMMSGLGLKQIEG